MIRAWNIDWNSLIWTLLSAKKLLKTSSYRIITTRTRRKCVCWKKNKKKCLKGLTQERERGRPAAALFVVGIRWVFYEQKTTTHPHATNHQKAGRQRLRELFSPKVKEEGSLLFSFFLSFFLLLLTSNCMSFTLFFLNFWHDISSLEYELDKRHTQQDNNIQRAEVGLGTNARLQSPRQTHV